MQLRDDRGAFPDGRPDSLHRAITDVADREDPLDSRLQRLWHSLRRAGVGSGSDEALRVEGDSTAGEPARRRIGSGEEEQVRNGKPFLCAGAPVAAPDALQAVIGRAEKLDDFGVA